MECHAFVVLNLGYMDKFRESVSTLKLYSNSVYLCFSGRWDMLSLDF